jgi:hypothetical protein
MVGTVEGLQSVFRPDDIWRIIGVNGCMLHLPNHFIDRVAAVWHCNAEGFKIESLAVVFHRPSDVFAGPKTQLLEYNPSNCKETNENRETQYCICQV